MCEDANLIAIGTVLSIEYGPATYRADWKFRPTERMTITTILVEGMITGNGRALIELRYYGDERTIVSISPTLHEGKRYLFFMIEGGPFELGGTVKVISNYTFPPNIEIPPDSVLRSLWEEHCLPGHGLGLRPTQALLPLMTGAMRATVERYCEHY